MTTGYVVEYPLSRPLSAKDEAEAEAAWEVKGGVVRVWDAGRGRVVENVPGDVHSRRGARRDAHLGGAATRAAGTTMGMAREHSYAGGGGAGVREAPVAALSPASAGVQSDHEFARQDLKYRLLRSLSRLNDKDTRVHACDELANLCEDLEPHQIAMFVHGLQHDLEGQYPFARRECVRMFGVVARCHGAEVLPVLPHLIAYTVRRFKDQDHTVREVAAEVCTAIAGAVAVPPGGELSTSGEGGPPPPPSPLLSALFDALKDQNKFVQQTTATALAHVLKERTLPVERHSHPQMLAKRFGRMLSAKTFHARGEVLLCVAALVERYGATVFAGGAPLGSAIMVGLRSCAESEEFGTRKHATAALLANVIHCGIDEVVSDCIVMLRDLRFDRVKPVRDSAIEALKVIKAAGKLPDATPSPGQRWGDPVDEGSATPSEVLRARSRSAPRQRVSPLRQRDRDSSNGQGDGAGDGAAQPVDSSGGRNEKFFSNVKDDTEVVVSASVRAAERRTRAGAIDPAPQEDKPAWLQRHKNASANGSPGDSPPPSSPTTRKIPSRHGSPRRSGASSPERSSSPGRERNVDAFRTNEASGSGAGEGDGGEGASGPEQGNEDCALRPGLSLKSMPGSPPARTLNDEEQATLNHVSDQQAEVMRAFAEANNILTAKNAALEERLSLVESQLAVLLGPVQEEQQKLDKRVASLEEAIRLADISAGVTGRTDERVDEIERVLKLAGIPIGDDNFEILAGDSKTEAMNPMNLLNEPSGNTDRGGAGAMTPWKIALGKLEQSDVPGAFDTVIAEKDEFLLVRLMGRTGPSVMPSLGGAHLVAIFLALSDLLSRGTFKETAISWTESLIGDFEALKRCAECDRGEGDEDVRVLQQLHDSITIACEAEDPSIAGHATRVQGELRAAAATAGYLEWKSTASPSRIREG